MQRQGTKPAQGVKAYLDDDFKTALSLADKALSLINVSLPSTLRYALLGLKRFEVGLASANQAVRLNPDYYGTAKLRAAHQGLGRSFEACSDYQISLSIFQRRRRFWIGLKIYGGSV